MVSCFKKIKQTCKCYQYHIHDNSRLTSQIEPWYMHGEAKVLSSCNKKVLDLFDNKMNNYTRHCIMCHVTLKPVSFIYICYDQFITRGILATIEIYHQIDTGYWRDLLGWGGTYATQKIVIKQLKVGVYTKIILIMLYRIVLYICITK